MRYLCKAESPGYGHQHSLDSFGICLSLYQKTGKRYLLNSLSYCALFKTFEIVRLVNSD